MEPLNMSAAEEVTFEALPKGTYSATVFEVTQAETSGEGKLGVRPMLKVQFAITEDGWENRRVFTQFVIPPAELDGQPYEHYGRMLGNIKSFFKALGYDEKEINKWKKFPDFDELGGRECRVTLGQREYQGDIQNEVKSVKPAGTADDSAGGLASL